MTVFERDETGNVTAQVTVRESEFSTTDVSVLLESRRLERLPRGDHGWPISEATNSTTNPANPDRTHDWVGKGPREDYAARAVKSAQDKYYAEHPTAKENPALMWRVEKVPRDKN